MSDDSMEKFLRAVIVLLIVGTVILGLMRASWGSPFDETLEKLTKSTPHRDRERMSRESSRIVHDAWVANCSRLLHELIEENPNTLESHIVHRLPYCPSYEYPPVAVIDKRAGRELVILYGGWLAGKMFDEIKDRWDRKLGQLQRERNIRERRRERDVLPSQPIDNAPCPAYCGHR